MISKIGSKGLNFFKLQNNANRAKLTLVLALPCFVFFTDLYSRSRLNYFLMLSTHCLFWLIASA